MEHPTSSISVDSCWEEEAVTVAEAVAVVASVLFAVEVLIASGVL
jgi:hypothetical protein